jgi:hypothetical protein
MGLGCRRLIGFASLLAVFATVASGEEIDTTPHSTVLNVDSVFEPTAEGSPPVFFPGLHQLAPRPDNSEPGTSATGRNARQAAFVQFGPQPAWLPIQLTRYRLNDEHWLCQLPTAEPGIHVYYPYCRDDSAMNSHASALPWRGLRRGCDELSTPEDKTDRPQSENLIAAPNEPFVFTSVGVRFTR